MSQVQNRNIFRLHCPDDSYQKTILQFPSSGQVLSNFSIRNCSQVDARCVLCDCIVLKIQYRNVGRALVHMVVPKTKVFYFFFKLKKTWSLAK